MAAHETANPTKYLLRTSDSDAIMLDEDERIAI